MWHLVISSRSRISASVSKMKISKQDDGHNDIN